MTTKPHTATENTLKEFDVESVQKDKLLQLLRDAPVIN